MYNWKLNALFIIGLTLIAGMFSNAAMAVTNDGKGEVTVAWGYQSNIISPEVGIANTESFLNAGSTHNSLQFTYTAKESDNSPINMAGGKFRVTFPRGWKVSNKLIKVSDGSDVVYQTDDMGDLDLDQIVVAGETLDTNEKKKAKANATVTFEADRHITVNLGSEWGSSRSDPSRELVIILSDVTVPIPSRLTEAGTTADDPAESSTFGDNYAKIQFQCSSSARNGTLSRLSGSVEVKVGNILGDRDLVVDGNGDGVPDAFETRDPFTTRDPLIREFKVEPGRVFPEDENIPVTITFEAPGPMYGSTLNIIIPNSFMPAIRTADTIRVSGGGATIDRADIGYSSGVAIPINTINRGQRITVSYRIKTVINVTGRVSATTTVGSAANVNAKVMGGVVSPVGGSGRMDTSLPFVTAGARHRTIILTYTAYTDLGDADANEFIDLVIRPDGIVLDSDHTLHENSNITYGYVSGSLGHAKLMIADGDNANATITWDNITLKKNQTLRTTIRGVHISETPGNYEWGVTVAGSPLIDDATTAIDERPVLSVVRTSGNPVQFDFDNIIDGNLDNDGKLNLRAGSKATIEFRFIADATPHSEWQGLVENPHRFGQYPYNGER